MNVLYYDCFCGISGDMNLGAFLDLGIDKNYLLNQLSKLKLNSEYDLVIKKENKKGIHGTRVDVILENDHEGQKSIESESVHVHHVLPKRALNDIETIIKSSALNDNVKKISMAIFRKLAEAEAKVHGQSLDEVHFHELGAVDSIIDIVGAAICLDYLKVDKIISSSVQVGGGFVKCAHGILPVPTPATVEILKDIPIKLGLVHFETTTPTGAAILAANVTKYTENMELSVEKIGYGIGHRDMDIPNILRIFLGFDNIKKRD